MLGEEPWAETKMGCGMGRKRVKKVVSATSFNQERIYLPDIPVLTGESARIFEEKAARNAANAHKLDFSEDLRWVESILRKSGMR